MNTEDIVRSSLDQLAHDIQPTAPDPVAVRSRASRDRRVRAFVVAGLAAAVAGAVIVGVTQFRDVDSAPTPPSTTLQQIDGTVWMVGTELHIGGQSFTQQSTAATGLAPTRNGAVYGTEDGDVVYQPLDGPAKVIATGVPWGPAADPDSNVVAWMQFSELDGQYALWLYDVARDRPISDVPMSDKNVEPLEGAGGGEQTPIQWIGQNDEGLPIVLYIVGQDVWKFESTGGAGGNGMIVGSTVYDVTGEVFADERGLYRMRFASPDGAELSRFVGIGADGGLSHDGAYYAGFLVDSEGASVVGIVDTDTGQMQPLDLPDDVIPSGLSWAGGHTLMLSATAGGADAESGSVMACDAATLVCGTVTELDDILSVTLPNL